MQVTEDNKMSGNQTTTVHQLALEAIKEGQTLDQYQAKLRNLDQRGRIELIIGCMFAGKSTELLRRVRKHEITGKRILTVKFSADNRYADGLIVTHEGQTRAATEVVTLAGLGNIWKDFDCIGIDEGQFFPDVVEFAENAANEGKIVIISSLGGTFLRGPFTRILELIPKCEKIKKLAAICKLCKQSASFTFRTASKNDQSMIGGADKYMPVCRECHYVQTQLNKESLFDGDAEVTNPDIEVSNKRIELPCQAEMQPQREVKIMETPSPQTVMSSATGSMSPKQSSSPESEEAQHDKSPMLLKFTNQNSLVSNEIEAGINN